MLYMLTIKKLVPWTEYNEYEGQIEGIVNEINVCCYVLMSSGKDWLTYAQGDNLNVDLWLERTDNVTVIEPSVATKLQQIAGVNYEVIGTVVSASEENLLLHSIFPLRVDLDISPYMENDLPEIRVGDKICVTGVLKVDLEPERV